MNFDLDTKDGMKNAVAWTDNMLDMIKDGGTWIVPRSGSMYKVDHKTKTVTAMSLLGPPEDCIDRVLKAGGWKVVGVGDG